MKRLQKAHGCISQDKFPNLPGPSHLSFFREAWEGDYCYPLYIIKRHRDQSIRTGILRMEQVHPTQTEFSTPPHPSNLSKNVHQIDSLR